MSLSRSFYRLSFLLGVVFCLAACSPRPTPAPTLVPSANPTASQAAATAVPAAATPTSLPKPLPTLPQPLPSTAAPSPSPTQDWRALPVIPTGVSAEAQAIYQRGLSLGNKPNAFSKVGDCESRAIWFLTEFDSADKPYILGPYAELQGVIDYYAGSYARLSNAALPSFNAASELSPLWADRTLCKAGETPLACEMRAWRPSLALVMLGTNDSPHPETFEANLRKVLDALIERGVLPVLATKADNLEGDGSINAVIAQLAGEYQLPLWNYWAAMQPLPRHGLQEDGAHLTLGPNHFDDPQALKSGWTVRNLTALQTLNAVWQGLEK